MVQYFHTSYSLHLKSDNKNFLHDKQWHAIWDKGVPNRISHSALQPELYRTVNSLGWLTFCSRSKTCVVAYISMRLVEDLLGVGH